MYFWNLKYPKAKDRIWNCRHNCGLGFAAFRAALSTSMAILPPPPKLTPKWLNLSYEGGGMGALSRKKWIRMKPDLIVFTSAGRPYIDTHQLNIGGFGSDHNRDHYIYILLVFLLYVCKTTLTNYGLTLFFPGVNPNESAQRGGGMIWPYEFFGGFINTEKSASLILSSPPWRNCGNFSVII